MEKYRLNQDYELQKAEARKGKTEDLTSASPVWRAWRETLRTLDWSQMFPNPSVSLTQINHLLALV